MPQMVRLTEWRTATALPLTPAERDALRGRLGVTIQATIGSEHRYDVTPGNTIGNVRVGDRVFVIEPKIPIDRVLFLLGYLADPRAWRDDDAVLGRRMTIVDAVAALFARYVERALERGILAGYHDVQDTLATVRGRIDLAEQLRCRPGLSVPLALRYSEYDHDVVENRLLLASLSLFRHLPIRHHETLRAVRRLRDSFSDVTPTSYSPARIPVIRWTRLNGHYRPAVELARVLLAQQSPELSIGAVSAGALSINMAAVFEAFVRTALQESSGLDPTDFPDGARCPPLRLDERGIVNLQPDLSRWDHERCTFVGDVKYKRDAGKGSNPDLYQLLTYALATNLPEATLVYAHGPSGERAHTVVHSGIRLHLRHVDLTLPPHELLATIRQLACKLGLAAAPERGKRTA